MRDDGRGTRVDALTGAVVRVAASRQRRPNLPSDGCPFCLGGLESPEPYTVKAFPNRWPSFDGDRCFVCLYGPEHGRTLAELGPGRAREVIDLWAERTEVLGRRDDVAYVLVFENHGAEVGATIDHPHGQVFAFQEVPAVPAGVLRRLRAGARLLEDEPSLVVVERDGWRAWVPSAPTQPLQLRLAPVRLRPDLPSLADDERDALAEVLVDMLGAVEHAWPSPVPYVLWWVQRPTDGRCWSSAWLHLELSSPWRADGVPRHIAAGELGSGVMINPVPPEEQAERLRSGVRSVTASSHPARGVAEPLTPRVLARSARPLGRLFRARTSEVGVRSRGWT